MAYFKVITLWLLVITSVLINLKDVNAATEYNRYLAHIFHKYGNGGTMSFEVICTLVNKVILLIFIYLLTYYIYNTFKLMQNKCDFYLICFYFIIYFLEIHNQKSKHTCM